jgi:hypothetical protein
MPEQPPPRQTQIPTTSPPQAPPPTSAPAGCPMPPPPGVPPHRPPHAPPAAGWRARWVAGISRAAGTSGDWQAPATDCQPGRPDAVAQHLPRPTARPEATGPPGSPTRADSSPEMCAPGDSSPEMRGLVSDLGGIVRAGGVISRFDHGQQPASPGKRAGGGGGMWRRDVAAGGARGLGKAGGWAGGAGRVCWDTGGRVVGAGEVGELSGYAAARVNSAVAFRSRVAHSAPRAVTVADS